MITELQPVRTEVVTRADSSALTPSQLTANSWLRLLRGDTSIKGVGQPGAVNGGRSNGVTGHNSLTANPWLRLLGGGVDLHSLNGRAASHTAFHIAVKPALLTSEDWVSLLSCQS